MSISALLFSYGKRNPAIGIVTSFAALTCGSGLNILFTSIDSSLRSMTLLSAWTLNSGYEMSIRSFIFIMIIAVLLISIIITYISERITAEKVEVYTFSEDEEGFKLFTSASKFFSILFSLRIESWILYTN